MATPRKSKVKASTPKPATKKPNKSAEKPAARPVAKPVAKAPVAKAKPAETAAKKPLPMKEKVPPTKSTAKPAAAVAPPPKKAAGRPAPVIQEQAPAAPKPRPKLTDADKQWQSAIRDMLVHRRDELQSVVQSSRAQMSSKSGDSADVADRASEGFEDELAAGLIAIEAAQLDDIDDAIHRIDTGDYGFCIVCDKPIPRKRLDFLPFAKRCITCEGSHERTRQVSTSYEEADDND